MILLERIYINIDNIRDNINEIISPFNIKYMIIVIIIGFIIFKIVRKIRLIRWVKSDFMDIDLIRKLDGYEFEKYMSKQFKTLGFKVEETPKSGDFGVDMIISKEYALQLKNYTNTVGISAIQEIYAGAAYYDKIPVVIVTNYYTKPAIELASALGIELIDIDDITNWGVSGYKRSFTHEKGFYEMVRGKINNNLNGEIFKKINNSR